MKYTPKDVPAISEGVHFVAQSERCCAAIVTNIYPVVERKDCRPQLHFSLYVMPADKIHFNMKDKKLSNVRQEEDTIHQMYDCKRTVYK